MRHKKNFFVVVSSPGSITKMLAYAYRTVVGCIHLRATLSVSFGDYDRPRSHRHSSKPPLWNARTATWTRRSYEPRSIFWSRTFKRMAHSTVSPQPRW